MSKIYQFFNTQKSSPLEKWNLDIFNTQNINFCIKRDDLLHQEVSGNKWRKLKYNLLEAEKLGFNSILTFGGAFSNHIAAVAAAGSLFNFKTIGLIRGEQQNKLNPTLQFASNNGMSLHYLSRSEYKKRNDLDFVNTFKKTFGKFYYLPEGGTNPLAIKGCEEIISEIEKQLNYAPDYICVPCGTGGTMAGLISKANPKTTILGFSALKGDFLKKEIDSLLDSTSESHFNNWTLNSDYHFGGYAKWNQELIDFINQTKPQITLDPIYTGKMLFGIFDLIKKGFFEQGSSIVMLHTGGLQGIKGFNYRFGELISS